LHDGLILLNTHSYALSLLLSGVHHSLKGGVPLTLTNTVFNSAKSMILGGVSKWKSEEEEEDIFQALDIEKWEMQDC
jgi:hypothetical protein